MSSVQWFGRGKPFNAEVLRLEANCQQNHLILRILSARPWSCLRIAWKEVVIGLFPNEWKINHAWKYGFLLWASNFGAIILQSYKLFEVWSPSLVQVCSAIICGTALGEVFEERREHKHESSILRLRPEDSSGDSLGGHVGHAHARQRGGSKDKGENRNIVKENREERKHHGHRHHVHQDSAGQPEEFSLKKTHDDQGHDQRKDHDEKEAHNNQRRAHNDHDHDEKEAHDNQRRAHNDHHNHDHDQQHADHRSISPKTKHTVQHRLKNPAEKHDHKRNKNKQDHENEENKEKVGTMSEFVAFEKGLGGINR